MTSADPRASGQPQGVAGDNVVVTGASRGLGRALALSLGARGATVHCLDQDEEGLRETVETMTNAGAHGAAHRCDLADDGEVERVVTAIGQHGPIHGLVAVAGGTASTRRDFLELDLATWDEMVTRNLTTAFLTALHCSRLMAAAGSGSIVLVSSIGAIVTQQSLVHYSAAKAGVEQLMRGMAAELGPVGIRVNAIAPGSFLTPGNEQFMDGTQAGSDWAARTPMRRLGTPSELTGAVAYLLSADASYTTGSTIVVDGGYSLV